MLLHSNKNKLGSLQTEILKRIADSSQRFTVNQLTTFLNKGHTTIFKSTDLLIQSDYLTFDQEYPRGRKWLKLTDLGACVAIGYYGISYTTIYKNHPYLQMPELFKELALCVIDESAKDEIVKFGAICLLSRCGAILRQEQQLIINGQNPQKHYTAALIIETLYNSLDRRSPRDFDYPRLKSLLTKAKTLFQDSVNASLENLRNISNNTSSNTEEQNSKA